MTEIVIPSGLRIARSSFKYIDQTGVSRGVFSGTVQTTGYGGDRVGASLDFTPAGGASTADRSLRAQIKAVLMASRGKQNRIFAEDNSTTRRGSFPATELFTNYDFSNGTTGWTSDSKYSLTAADGVLRATSILQASTGLPMYQTITTTQFAPYAVRVLVRAGRGTFASLYPLLDNSIPTILTGGAGYGAVGFVVQNGSQFAGVYDSSSTGIVVGDYLDLCFASAARCALSDTAGNLFTKSDELDHADWTKNEATISADSATIPYGVASGDKIVPSTNNASHYVFQTKTATSAAQDIFLGGVFIASGYNFVRLQLTENTGSTSASYLFNLSTGAVGSTTATGANWANLRPIIRGMGGGWYYCAIVARKTNAATSITGLAVVQNADSIATFAGNGTSGIYGGRLTMFPSSSFIELVASTTAAVAANTTSGSAVRLKGLPVSTAGLLLAGDWVEIDGQLKLAVASLNSDAAGLGYLQFSPPLRRAISDNTPIIVNRPMGRFILAGDAMWNNVPGVFSDASVELEEAWS